MTKGIIKQFQKQYLNFFKRVKTLQGKISPDKIHDLRVLSRRLRASISFLQIIQTHPKKLKSLRSKIKKITRDLSSIRSHDVNEEVFRQRLPPRHSAERKYLKGMFSFFEKERKYLEKKSFKKISKISLPEKISTLQNKKLSKNKLEAYFSDLELQMKKAKRDAQQSWNLYRKNENLNALHPFRISLKKYRYLVEIKYLDEKKQKETILKPFKKLQDQMGGIHDLDVLHQYLSNKTISKEFSKPIAKQVYQGFLMKLKNEIQRRLKNFRPQNQPQIQKILEKSL